MEDDGKTSFWEDVKVAIKDNGSDYSLLKNGRQFAINAFLNLGIICSGVGLVFGVPYLVHQYHSESNELYGDRSISSIELSISPNVANDSPVRVEYHEHPEFIAMSNKLERISGEFEELKKKVDKNYEVK